MKILKYFRYQFTSFEFNSTNVMSLCHDKILTYLYYRFKNVVLNFEEVSRCLLHKKDFILSLL